MTELSKPKARPTHLQGERRLWFMVQGQTILNMTDADIERLVDETFPDPPGQRPVKHSKRPRAVGKPLKKADGP